MTGRQKLAFGSIWFVWAIITTALSFVGVAILSDSAAESIQWMQTACVVVLLAISSAAALALTFNLYRVDR